MMKRILVLSELIPNKFGSMEEFDIFIARELRQRGHRCYFGFTAEPDLAVKEMLEDAGGEVADELYTCRNGKKLSLLVKIVNLSRYIADNKIDLIHINFYSLTNPYLMGAYMSGAKIVFTDHTSGSGPARNSAKFLLSKIIHILLKRRIASYVPISNFVRDRMSITHYVSQPQSVTIYNGVNLARFMPRDKALARSRTALPIDGKTVVAIANLIPEKGLQHLIVAAALLVAGRNCADFKIVIVGEGSFHQKLEKLAQLLGIRQKISFLGRRSDVAELISASDIVVVPSVWQEGFGLIVAEAMAAGRPVIASRVGGISELIEDGVSGLLVEPGDSHALAAKMRELFADKAIITQLVEQALDKARSHFNLNLQTARYADLFENVLLR